MIEPSDEEIEASVREWWGGYLMKHTVLYTAFKAGYLAGARRRIDGDAPLFATVEAAE